MLRPLLASIVALIAAAPLLGANVDLTVAGVEITQTIQNASGTLSLVAHNPTMVRVRVGVVGATSAVPGVDAELRVYANGVEIPGSPFFSINGPIAAPLSPNAVNENDTLNFLVTPPQSLDVDFVVTLNPLRTVPETNYANNEGQSLNRAFLCRKMVGLAFVSVNYTPGGGQPDGSLIEPGRGDAMLRGIFKTGDWNYHRSPLGALTWTQNINNSNNALLNTLSDIRNNQIPAAGVAKPAFIYGWLPGNPYSGNGQANGIPGDAAFGNTQLSRFQRTFAHEVGHLWGQPHNSQSISVVGVDVVNQLKDPLNLGPMMPTTKKDVMVPGLLTEDAWVAAITFNDCISDPRSQCTSFDGEGEGGGGGADDAVLLERCLRIAGETLHREGRIALVQSQRFDAVEATVDDPAGDVRVLALDATGAARHEIRVRTGTSRECCAGHGLLDATPFHVFVPETVGNAEIAAIEIRDVRSGRVLARQERSRAVPIGAILSVTGAAEEGGAMPGAANGKGEPAPVLDGEIEVRFAATDPDGDPLVANLLYSPDGGDAWVPLGVNLDVAEGVNVFRFPSGNVPRSRGIGGIVKLRVSDGLNVSDEEFPLGMALGFGSPPDVHVIAPHDGIQRPQWGSVVLHASAWDMEDELIPEQNVVWTSDRDGFLGAGRLFTVRSLSVGTHMLTVTGTDLDGMSSARQTTVTITPRAVRSADLDFDGTVGPSDLAILLGAWGGDGLADLDLDGTVGPADLAILLGSWIG
jgi:hypothetical protein